MIILSVRKNLTRRRRKMPKDPVILLSYVNTQLRDFYTSLEEFCKAMSVSSDGLQKTLKTIGYVYVAEKNQFS